MRRLLLSLLCLGSATQAAVVVASADEPDVSFDHAATHSSVALAPAGEAFVVDVMIGSRGPYPFALDTGASNAIDTDLAQELGLVPESSELVQGAGEATVSAGLVHLPRATIGDVRLHEQLFHVLPLVSGTPTYTPPYRGLIGHELFDRLVVRIEPDKRRVEFSDPAGWSYTGAAACTPLDLHGHLPVVDGVIDGVAGRFTLDTGQANSVTLFAPFLSRGDLWNKWSSGFSTDVSWGVGGTVLAEVARANMLSLGAAQVDRPILYLSLQRFGAFSDDDVAGNVGVGVFSRFDVTFAYQLHCAWFERNVDYARGDSMHVMTLQRSMLGYTVVSVLPGGAAALAGLKPGDSIEYVENRDASQIEDAYLNQAFRRPPGTTVNLTVRTKGHLRNVDVVLRPTI